MKISKFIWRDLTVEAYNKNSKTYSTVIHNMSGEIECGKLSVIMGPSGAGKTTLINTLSGVVPKKFKTRGQIFIDDMERPLNFSDYIGVFQQEDVCFEYYSVFDYLYFNTVGRRRKSKYSEIFSEIENVLKELHLEDKRNNYLSDISGGERRRVMVAKELLSGKPILFFDEPTANLDSYLALSLIIYLNEFAKNTNKIIFISIHQPSEAISNLFDRFIFINEGKVLYNGKYSEAENFFITKGFKKPSKLTFIEYLFILTANDNKFNEIEIENKDISSLQPPNAESITNSGESLCICQYKFSFNVFMELLKRNFKYDMLSVFRKNLTRYVLITLLLCVYMKFTVYQISKTSNDSLENSLWSYKVFFFFIIFILSTSGNQEFYRRMFDLTKLLRTEVKNSCYTPIEYILALTCYGFLESCVILSVRMIFFTFIMGSLCKISTITLLVIPAILFFTHFLVLISMTIKNGICVSIFLFIQHVAPFFHILVYYVKTYEIFFLHTGAVILNIIVNLLPISSATNVFLFKNKPQIFLEISKNTNEYPTHAKTTAYSSWLERLMVAFIRYGNYLNKGKDILWIQYYKLAFVLYFVWSTLLGIYVMRKKFCVYMRYKLEK